MGTQDACSVSDYVNGDSELPVCTDLDNDHWEDNFMDSLTQENTMTPTEEDSDPESDVDLDPPIPVLKDFKEAIQTLEHVLHFLESRNCLEMATKMSALLTEVAAHHVSAMHQTTLTQFFSRAEDTEENDIWNSMSTVYMYHIIILHDMIIILYMGYRCILEPTSQ